MNPQEKTSLKSVVTALEELQAERVKIDAEIKERLAEAKDDGFNLKALREVLRRRKIDRSKRAAIDDLVEQYEFALSEPAPRAATASSAAVEPYA